MSIFSSIGDAFSSMFSAIGGAVNPQAPSPSASPTPPSLSSPQVQQSAEDEENLAGRGETANMLTGGSGVTTQAPVSRNVLLGS